MQTGSNFLDRWRWKYANRSVPGLSANTWGRCWKPTVDCSEQGWPQPLCIARWGTKGQFHENTCRPEGISSRYACTRLIASVARREVSRWCDRTFVSWRSSVLQRLRRNVRERGEQHSWIQRCCYHSPRGWWRTCGRASMQPQLIGRDGQCAADEAGRSTFRSSAWCELWTSALCRWGLPGMSR